MVSPVVKAAPKKRGLLSALSGATTRSRVTAGTKLRSAAGRGAKRVARAGARRRRRK